MAQSFRLSLPVEIRALWYQTLLARLRLDSRPIIVGNWRGEVGFEVLYWLPFVARLIERAQIDPARLVTVTRGGAACWYPGTQSIDLYALRELAEVRTQNLEDYLDVGSMKQFRASAWDRAVIRDAAQRLGLARYHVLHPSWMYWLLAPYWNDQASLQYLERHAKFASLPVPDLPADVTLPETFVAVKFYARATFPLSPQILHFITQTLGPIAKTTPVVLLNQPHHFDEHVDAPLQGPNVIQLPAVPPEQSLALQAAVMARATAFVGTYGGVAQMALRYRKPVTCYYTHIDGTAPAHLSLSQRLGLMTGVAFEAYRVGPASLGQQLKAVAA